MTKGVLTRNVSPIAWCWNFSVCPSFGQDGVNFIRVAMRSWSLEPCGNVVYFMPPFHHWGCGFEWKKSGTWPWTNPISSFSCAWHKRFILCVYCWFSLPWPCGERTSGSDIGHFLFCHRKPRVTGYGSTRSIFCKQFLHVTTLFYALLLVMSLLLFVFFHCCFSSKLLS